MKISMIAALGPKREIGFNNKLLWHIPEDLKNFKKLTTGKTIVMGRKTFDSIGKALPNRKNIVITSDPNFKFDGVEVINDPMMIFDLVLMNEDFYGDEVVIIGGGKIYDFFLPYAQTLYLSEVNYEGPADTFFPAFDITDWCVIEKISYSEFNFLVLDRA